MLVFLDGEEVGGGLERRRLLKTGGDVVLDWLDDSHWLLYDYDTIG